MNGTKIKSIRVGDVTRSRKPKLCSTDSALRGSFGGFAKQNYMAFVENPWVDLPGDAPFVLPHDERPVDRFNAHAADKHKIITDLLPEPHIGSFDAPVVLLDLNPGFNKGDYAVHSRPSFKSALLKTIRGERTAFPFYYLDPGEDGPGQQWWRQRLRPLMEAASADAVAGRILCVELFPYHSKEFAHSKVSLPSKRFALQLVRSAMARRALIVVMRGYQYWSVEIREFGAYRRVLRLSSPHNLTISRGNCPQGFDEIVAELSAQEMTR